MLDKTEFFECECNSDEHTLRFILSLDKEDASIYTTMFLHEWSWYKRVWIGLKYIFGYKCRFGHWDCFSLKAEDAERLKELLEQLIAYHKLNQISKV